MRVAKTGHSFRGLDDPRFPQGAAAAEIQTIHRHRVRFRVDLHELALVCVLSGAWMAVRIPILVVSAVCHPEVVRERGGLDEREAVVLVDGAWVGHGDMRMARKMDDLRILLAQRAIERAGLLYVRVLVELTVPAIRARVPYGVRKGMVREQENGLVWILCRRFRAAFENPVALSSVPAVVVSTRLGRDRQNMVSTHNKVGIYLAFVCSTWSLERVCHAQP